MSSEGAGRLPGPQTDPRPGTVSGRVCAGGSLREGAPRSGLWGWGGGCIPCICPQLGPLYTFCQQGSVPGVPGSPPGWPEMRLGGLLSEPRPGHLGSKLKGWVWPPSRCLHFSTAGEPERRGTPLATWSCQEAETIPGSEQWHRADSGPFELKESVQVNAGAFSGWPGPARGGGELSFHPLLRMASHTFSPSDAHVRKEGSSAVSEAQRRPHHSGGGGYRRRQQRSVVPSREPGPPWVLGPPQTCWIRICP